MSGTIYVLSNPAIPDAVMLGYSQKENIKGEIAGLYNPSVPVPFKCEMATSVENARTVFDLIREVLEYARYTEDREFYRVPAKNVIALLKLTGGKDVTPEQEEQNTSPLEVSPSLPANGRRKAVSGRRRPKTKSASSKQRRPRRPNLNFQQLGILPGSIIKGRDGKEATVHGDRRVRFEGEVMFITPATRRMLGTDDSVVISAAQYWTYNGRKISEMYNELHPDPSETGN